MRRRRFIRNKKQLQSKGLGQKKYILNGLNSKSEKFFLDVVETIYNVKIERQFPLSNRYYDGRFENHLIEIDGSRWHTRLDDVRRDKVKDKLAQRAGFKIHRIKLDKMRDVPIALTENKKLLDEIFNGNSSKKS